MPVLEESLAHSVELKTLLAALNSLKKGDFSVRLPADWTGTAGKVADTFNDVIELNARMTREFARLSRVVGQDGKITQRANLGDVSGGWTLNMEQVRVGITRTMYPFFAGLLLSRITKPSRIKHAFLWCSLLIALVLYMPRVGGAEHLWMNGVYESLCIIFIFPLIVYLGASGVIHTPTERRICKFLGELSYPLYLVHYPLVYFYVAWISNHKGITIAQARASFSGDRS